MRNGSRSLWPIMPDRTEQRGFLVLILLFCVWFGISGMVGNFARSPEKQTVTRCESLPYVNNDPAGRIEEIPGIGIHRANRIVEYRRREGPFRSFDELRDVPGIGPDTVKRVERHARLRPCEHD